MSPRVASAKMRRRMGEMRVVFALQRAHSGSLTLIVERKRTGERTIQREQKTGSKRKKFIIPRRKIWTFLTGRLQRRTRSYI